MKKNIILLVILVILFIFGLLIYDFSDKLDDNIVNNSWYAVEGEDVYQISFKDNNFEYLKNNVAMVEFENCHNYHFNSSSNVVKLGCGNKKAYIASFDKEELILTIDKKENTYFPTLDVAYTENFKKINKLTDDEYSSLLAVDLSEYTSITVKKLTSIYKGKKKEYIALINEKINYENAFNIAALSSILQKTNDKYKIIYLDKLTEEELKKLNSYTKKTEYNNDELLIYEVGNKKVKLSETISISSKEELKHYQNI